MAVRYFLIQMARRADQQMKGRTIPSWGPRHLEDILTGSDKYESMGNARRFVLARLTADDAKLDTLDNLPGVVELADVSNPARFNRVEAVLATRGISVDLDGVTQGEEAALRIQAAIQAVVAIETPDDRRALAAQMIAGN